MNKNKVSTLDYKLFRSGSEPTESFVCKVKSLKENDVITIDVQKDCSGQWLLDEICEIYECVQKKDYFGLRYTDKDKQKLWVDLGRNVYRQLKDTQPIVVSFRLKHFPEFPLYDLNDELASYFLYLQLRHDLYGGRLMSKTADMHQLAALAVQDELGDYDAENNNMFYQLKLLPNLSAKAEQKIIEIHKSLIGVSKVDARIRFLEKASTLDTYGVEPFNVKDQKGNNLYVGLTHEGISTFQGSRRAHLFKWCDLNKILFKGKLFIVHVFLEEIFNSKPIRRKHILGFKCDSSKAAEALWKWANDRKCFFWLNRSSDARKIKSGGGLLRKRCTFKFAGRCQKEMQTIYRSLNCLDSPDGGILQKVSLMRENEIIENDMNNADQIRFNTMPGRDKEKILGTQDTLNSLFMSVPIKHKPLLLDSGHRIPYESGSINYSLTNMELPDSPKILSKDYLSSNDTVQHDLKTMSDFSMDDIIDEKIHPVYRVPVNCMPNEPCEEHLHSSFKFDNSSKTSLVTEKEQETEPGNNGEEEVLNNLQSAVSSHSNEIYSGKKLSKLWCCIRLVLISVIFLLFLLTVFFLPMVAVLFAFYRNPKSGAIELRNFQEDVYDKLNCFIRHISGINIAELVKALYTVFTTLISRWFSFN